MHPISQSLVNVLFPNKKTFYEFKKPAGYKNISCTEMRDPVEKKNDTYCNIS